MTEPTSPPTYKVTSEEEIQAYSVGGVKRHDAPITLVDYDPEWPALFAREEARIRSILGDRVVEIHHTGSTSVPGLAAKPVIDITLVVPDSSDEPAYVPDLEAAGYRLWIREPELVRAPRLQGPRHERQPPRLLAGLPGDRADGRVPRLAPDPRRRSRALRADEAGALDADLGLRPELRRREDRRSSRRSSRGPGCRRGSTEAERRGRASVARVDSRLGGGYRPLHAMNTLLLLSTPGMTDPGA